MTNVLIATSECVPFIKTGGLADVAGSLPKYIPKDEYDVRVVLPKYACIRDEYKYNLRYVKHFYINMSGRDQYVGIMETEYEGIKYYFIDNEEHFQGGQPYSGMPWDLGKFTYFCKAVLSMLPEIQFKPDVINCNDWQTALIPAFLLGYKSNYGFYKDIKTVMTIHNLKFQGIWNIEDVKRETGLDDSFFNYDRFEFYGTANLLKGGISYADMVTTVSNTYAREICSYEYGEGLDPLLVHRQDRLVGILNGIDYDVYNPEKDKFIYANYTAADAIEKKAINKRKLQEELGLEVDENKMLFGIISRLTDQKGLDLIRDVMHQLMEDGIQLVVIGTGERGYEDMFKYYDYEYSNQVSANICYNEKLAQKVYASCDGFLMPSRFEPCGLSQLMSMRYGTIPVVRKTGGLADTVTDVSADPENGTGFVFEYYDSASFLNSVREAENIYRNDRKQWNEIVIRAMERDFSWNRSALEYCKLYQRVIKGE